MNISNAISLQVLFHGLVVVALAVNVSLAALARGGFGGSEFNQLSITFLTAPECPHCFSLDPFRDYFRDNGVDVDQIKELSHKSRAGKALVKQYGVSAVPTVIVRGPVNDYAFMNGLVESIGEMRGNAFVVTRVQPPYVDLRTGKVLGEFEAIYLDDASCNECYDVALHDDILDRLGLHPIKRTRLDISGEEGNLFLDAYTITAVPTILFRGDLLPYEGLHHIWPDVGTVEEDGVYVLRQGVASMGTYKRLPEGDIITPLENDVVFDD